MRIVYLLGLIISFLFIIPTLWQYNFNHNFILICLVFILIVCFNKVITKEIKINFFTVIVNIILIFMISIVINLNKLKVFTIQKLDNDYTIIVYSTNRFPNLLGKIKNDFYLREKKNFLYSKDYATTYEKINKNVDIICATNYDCLKENDVKMIYKFSNNLSVLYSYRTKTFIKLKN